MSNDARWTISSSGPYMFVRFAVGTESPESYSTGALGFLAKIHYGKEILNVSMIDLIKQCHSIAGWYSLQFNIHIFVKFMSHLWRLWIEVQSEFSIQLSTLLL